MSCFAGFLARAYCRSRADEAMAVMPRGSVSKFIADPAAVRASGFDVQTQRCNVLPGLEPLPISRWLSDDSALYFAIYNILEQNDVLKQKSARGNVLNLWSRKFEKFAKEWHRLLDGTSSEILSRIIHGGLPLHELPYGSVKADDWCKAHAPSVLCCLYRGLPDEKRSSLGEIELLDAWKQHVLQALKAGEADDGGAHPNIAIANFDEFT